MPRRPIRRIPDDTPIRVSQGACRTRATEESLRGQPARTSLVNFDMGDTVRPRPRPVAQSQQVR